MSPLTKDPESYVIDNPKQVGDGATCATEDSHSALSATDGEHLPSPMCSWEESVGDPPLCTEGFRIAVCENTEKAQSVTHRASGTVKARTSQSQ